MLDCGPRMKGISRKLRLEWAGLEDSLKVSTGSFLGGLYQLTFNLGRNLEVGDLVTILKIYHTLSRGLAGGLVPEIQQRQPLF